MIVDKQVLYDGRWVNREHFRVFVYNSQGQKLANSYDEYSELISSGIWHAEPNQHNDNNVVEIKRKRGKKCQSQQRVSDNS